MYRKQGSVRLLCHWSGEEDTHRIETIRHDQEHVLRSCVVQSRTGVVTIFLQVTLNAKLRSVEAIENVSKIKELQVRYEP